MRKGIVVAILALSFALPAIAQEQPQPVRYRRSAVGAALRATVNALRSKPARRVEEYFVYAAPLAASLVATHEAHNCRVRNGIAPCDGGYGPFATREGLRFSLALTLDGLSMYGHHEGFGEWMLPALGNAAWNGVIAYHQANRSCGAGYHFLYGTRNTCVDDEKEYDFRRFKQ